MTMSNTWDYRDDIDVGDTVVGYDVDATDGDIGKIDEASTDAGRRYLVVDTGFWIFGKKRMIPAGVVTRVDHDGRKRPCLHDQGPDQVRPGLRRGGARPSRRRLPRIRRWLLPRLRLVAPAPGPRRADRGPGPSRRWWARRDSNP